jgi:hypothetical protein
VNSSQIPNTINMEAVWKNPQSDSEIAEIRRTAWNLLRLSEIICLPKGGSSGFRALRIKHLQGQAAKGFSKGRNMQRMPSRHRSPIS